MPYDGVKQVQVLVGISTGELALTWPPHLASRSDYRPLAKLVALCTDRSPELRPTFRQIAKALDKLQQSLRSRSAAGGSGGSRRQQQQQQQAAAAGPSQLYSHTLRQQAASAPPQQQQ